MAFSSQIALGRDATFQETRRDLVGPRGRLARHQTGPERSREPLAGRRRRLSRHLTGDLKGRDLTSESRRTRPVT